MLNLLRNLVQHVMLKGKQRLENERAVVEFIIGCGLVVNSQQSP